MAVNQFLPFGTGVGANTITPTAYAAHALRTSGHLPGVALSEVVNTTFRQTSMMAAAWGQLIADITAQDALDDGNLAALQAKLKAVMEGVINENQFWRPGDIKASMSREYADNLSSGIDRPGWLVADGRLITMAQYPALYLALYASDVGPNPIPDLRGMFLRGISLNSGRDPGGNRLPGQGQAGAVGHHSHRLPLEVGGNQDTYTLVNSGNADDGAFNNGAGVQVFTDTVWTNNNPTIEETRPPNTGVIYMIKT